MPDLQWEPAGIQGFAVEFARQLTSVELEGTPAVTLEQRTQVEPELWADRTSEVTVSGQVISTGDQTNSKVSWQLAARSGSEPESGNDYRFLVIVERNDGTTQVVASPSLEILP